METKLQSLSAEFRAKLFAFVRKRVRSDADADDVVQDVFTKLVLHGTPPGSVHAWLFTVARNAIIDRSRARSHQSLGTLAMVEEASEQGNASAELAGCLGPMLSVLSDDDRRVLERVDLGGECQSELARELGLSASGFKSRVQRARSRLRDAMEECCTISLDTRGAPLDCQVRVGSECACRCSGDSNC